MTNSSANAPARLPRTRQCHNNSDHPDAQRRQCVDQPFWSPKAEHRPRFRTAPDQIENRDADLNSPKTTPKLNSGKCQRGGRLPIQVCTGAINSRDNDQDNHDTCFKPKLVARPRRKWFDRHRDNGFVMGRRFRVLAFAHDRALIGAAGQSTAGRWPAPTSAWVLAPQAAWKGAWPCRQHAAPAGGGQGRASCWFRRGHAQPFFPQGGQAKVARWRSLFNFVY